MTLKTRSFLLLIPAALLAGCNSNQGYVPKPVAEIEPLKMSAIDETKIIPLSEGSQWTYSVESSEVVNGKKSGPPDRLVVYRVAKRVEDNAGGKIHAQLEMTSDNTVIERQNWYITKDGFFQASAGVNAVPFVPAQPVAQFPLKPGSTFKWSGAGMCPDGNPGTSKMTFTVGEPQNVDTEMGTISAIPIESKFSYSAQSAVDGPTKGDGTSTTWFKPGLGIIRFKQQFSYGTKKANKVCELVIRLKNYALKQS